MSKQQHSTSLQIVQTNQQLIQITQNSFQIEVVNQREILEISKHNDTFELSLDEHSLTFNIEERDQDDMVKGNILKQGNLNQDLEGKKNIFAERQTSKKVLPLVHQQRKRKRKQIFQKYKQKSTQNLVTGPDLQSNGTDLMNTFDQIFRIKSPQKSSSEKRTSITLSAQSQNLQTLSSPKKSPSITQFQPLTTNAFRKKQSISTAQVKLGSLQQFQIPSNISKINTIDLESNVILTSTNSFLIQTDQVNKISIILQRDNPTLPEIQQKSRQISGQYSQNDIQMLLKSEIFKEENFGWNSRTIAMTDTEYKNVQVSTMNPSVYFKSPEKNSNKKQVDILDRFSSSNKNTNLLKRQKSQESLNNDLQLNNGKALKKIFSQQIISTKHLISPQKPFKQQIQNFLKHHPQNSIQNRIPCYLRQVRKLNTIYPNFYFLPKHQQPLLQFITQQNQHFKLLLQQFKKCLIFLNQVNQTIYSRFLKTKQIQNILLNSMTIETFISCGWDKVQQQGDQNQLKRKLYELKPHQNFIRRKYEYEKVKGALNNYIYISQYYQKGELNLAEEKGQQKYIEIRKKFWQIEKNIKMIGEDIYTLSTQHPFPSHYYDFLKVLKGQPRIKNSRSTRKLQHLKKLLTLYYKLRTQGDLLCNSQIGICCKVMIEKEIEKCLVI